MDLYQLGLHEAAKRLSKKELTSEELVLALYARIEEKNRALNALVHLFRDRALERARLADEARRRGESLGPLHGLPITVKENIATRGTDVTLGIASRRGKVAEHDAVVVKVLERAGAIVIGKGNIPQTLLFHEADNPIWGRTLNPWSADRVPGGSSGGEAAAIAAGMAPAGIGTDIGGSIRVPAAFSGIAGLKPTLDRWSNVGCTGAMAGQELIRSQCGPLARTTRDVAFLFRAADSPIHGVYDPAVPPMLTPDPQRTDVSLLRIGYYTDDRFLPAAASVSRGVEQAAQALRDAGARVSPFELPSPIELTYLYFAALSADGGKTLDKLLLGDPVVEQLSSIRRAAKLPGLLRRTLAAFLASQGEARIDRLLSVVHEKSVSDLWGLAAERSRLRLETIAAWDRAGLDAVVCPAHATPALRHGQSRDFSLGASYSMHYNTLNFPAGVVPVTRVRASETTRPSPMDRVEKIAAAAEEGSAGLPIGVQVVARPFREDIVLAVMAAIEERASKDPEYPGTPVP